MVFGFFVFFVGFVSVRHGLIYKIMMLILNKWQIDLLKYRLDK